MGKDTINSILFNDKKISQKKSKDSSGTMGNHETDCAGTEGSGVRCEFIESDILIGVNTKFSPHENDCLGDVVAKHKVKKVKPN